MLSFQKLRVYQRSNEFLALALEIIAELPSSVLHACTRLRDGSGSRVGHHASHEVGQAVDLRSRERSSRRYRRDAHKDDLIMSTSRSKVALMGLPALRGHLFAAMTC